MLAMGAGSEELAFLFLEIRANLKQTCNKGNGLAWYAVWHSCRNVPRYLLERGGNVNYGAPLLKAVSGVRAGREMTQLLLDAAAHMKQQDEQRCTSPRIAFDNDDQDVMELLLERSAFLNGAGPDESQCRHLVSRPRLDH